MSKGLGQLTPAEVAKRCEARGARVIERGGRFVVYPPDTKHRSLAFSAVKMQGSHAANLVADLKKRGLDIMADTPADEPVVVKRSTEPPREITQTPAVPEWVRTAFDEPAPEKPGTTEKKESPVAQPVTPSNQDGPFTQRPTVVPFDYRKAYEDLKGQVAALAKRLDEGETATLAMLEPFTTRLEEMDQRLETVAPKPKPKPPSTSELVRREVLAFLTDTAPLKWSPSAVEGNIAEKLPEGRAKTSVALALQFLAEKGQIKGGARAVSPTMGLYWAEKPEVTPAAKTS